jgi:TRAP-type C4-dicarboxylate transport system permease small subunit
MKTLKKVYRGFSIGLEWFAMIALVLMTSIVFIDVILRYVFNHGMPWTQEISILLLVWFSLIGMAIGVLERIHISIEMFTMKLPKRVINLLEIIDHLFIMIFGIAMVYYGGMIMNMTQKSTMPATKLPSAVLYVILPLSGILIVLNAIVVISKLSDRARKNDTQRKSNIKENNK